MKAISVDDLFLSGKISRKTYNVLVRARMLTMFDLKRYETGLPRLFRNGTTGIKEINTLLRQMDTSDGMPEMTTILFPTPEPVLSKGEQLLTSLSDDELTLLDMVYRKQLAKMVRSQERSAKRMAHALMSVSVSAFVRDFLLEDEERIMMLNVGEASIHQVDMVKEAINKEIDIIRNKGVLLPYRIATFQAGDLLLDDTLTMDYFQKNNRLPMLYIIQKAILANKERPMFMAFLNRYDILDDKAMKDDDLVEKMSYPATNYSNALYDALFTPGASSQALGTFVSELMGDKACFSYLYDMFDSPFVDAEDERLAILAEEEGLILKPQAIICLLGKMMSDRFVCIGGYPRSLGTAHNNRWSHAYLVNHSLAHQVDFVKVYYHLRDNVVRVSTENYALDLEEILPEIIDQQFVDVQTLRMSAVIIKRILIDELALVTDEDGRLLIPKMREKSLGDRLYDILDKNKEPMLLDELTECINSGEGRRYVRASVSLALNKDPRFQGNGKKGYYGLSIWDLPYFGSNADIVYKVLSESGRPMRGEEIVAILSKYSHNSSFTKNDLASVVSLGKKRFRLFGLGYYGLVGVDYPPEVINPDKRSFDQEMEALDFFLDTHRRVPSTKGTEEERRLRGWFQRKSKEWENDCHWSEKKKEAFQCLVAKFNSMLYPEDVPLSIFNLEQEESGNEASNGAGDADRAEPHVPIQQPGRYEGPGDALPEADTPPQVEEEEGAAPVRQETSDVVAEEFVTPEERLETEAPVEPGTQETVKEEGLVETIDYEGLPSEAAVLWYEVYDEVRAFVETNHREPLAMLTAEVALAEWLCQQKYAMQMGVLSDSQAEAMLTLRNTLWPSK